LRRRRGDAPFEQGLVRRQEPREARNDDERKDRPDANEEPVRTEDDVSLRPLARALLALAEQLRREERS